MVVVVDNEREAMMHAPGSGSCTTTAGKVWPAYRTSTRSPHTKEGVVGLDWINSALLPLALLTVVVAIVGGVAVSVEAALPPASNGAYVAPAALAVANMLDTADCTELVCPNDPDKGDCGSNREVGAACA
jgi:hypothetical protein